MENGLITKVKPAKKGKNTVSVLLKGVPMWFHKRMMDYRRKINFERRQAFTLPEAYVEYLKDVEKTVDE